MFNIFEQPYTLLAVAIIAYLVIVVVRIARPVERKWRHFLPVFLIVISAFGLDLLVQTDLEKINTILDTCRKAIEQEDTETIAGFISPDYRDSTHNTGGMLMAVCQALLSEPLVEKITQTNKEIQLSQAAEKGSAGLARQATATLGGLVILEQQSAYSQYKSFVLLKGRLYFQKDSAKEWLIHRVELLEIDRHKMSWKGVGL